MESVYKDDGFKQMILDDMNRLGTENKLSGIERVKDICLTSEPFTIENGILTPTFKLKRNIAKKVYQAQCDAMYAELVDKAK